MGMVSAQKRSTDLSSLQNSILGQGKMTRPQYDKAPIGCNGRNLPASAVRHDRREQARGNIAGTNIRLQKRVVQAGIRALSGSCAAEVE